MRFTEQAKKAYGKMEDDIVKCFMQYGIEHCIVIPEDSEVDLCIDGAVLRVREEIILAMGIVSWADLIVEETPAAKKHKAVA